MKTGSTNTGRLGGSFPADSSYQEEAALYADLLKINTRIRELTPLSEEASALDKRRREDLNSLANSILSALPQPVDSPSALAPLLVTDSQGARRHSNGHVSTHHELQPPPLPFPLLSFSFRIDPSRDEFNLQN
jgi:hypothetical protein